MIEQQQNPTLPIHGVSRCPSINFFNVDCIEFMKSKPDKCYDLAIVDPPYGLPQRSGQGAGKLKNRIIQKMHQRGWDIAPTTDYFNELFRISKDQIIWGGNYFNLPPTRGFLIWDKEQPWENFSACEFAWTSFDTTANIFRECTTRTNEIKRHPTQKSVKLYRYTLKKYATEGMKLLDTHGGSMNSAIACEIEGFDLDICEIDKEYFQAGINAFNLHKRQQRLF
jgi:site-specific DNA-methyltransferase (adenine-specific)